MPVYQLAEEIIFPNPMLAGPDGLLAIGGDLSSPRLLEAYGNGIFPWYSEGQPYLWWSPDPRMVLYPKKFKKYKNLRKIVFNHKFQVKVDCNFDQVIKHCASVPRHGQDGDTWITSEMISAYIDLHTKGFAHSVEVYDNTKMVGGLYGVSLAGTFFGESMFHLINDASKVALWHLADLVSYLDFDLIDVQQDTDHLRYMGAENVNRKDFLSLLARSLGKKDIKGNWGSVNYIIKQ